MRHLSIIIRQMSGKDKGPSYDNGRLRNVVPLSEYLYRPDCEYLDGELLKRNIGEWDDSRGALLWT
jgi:hypothetical protein